MKKSKTKGVVTIHAGHNPDGKIACGASDYIKESTQARYLVKEICKRMKADGYTAYNCTVNNGTNQLDVLKKICEKCNSKQRALDVSIHFNATAHQSKTDSITTGTEAWIFDVSSSKSVKAAQALTKAIVKFGFRNRGIKTSKSLYFLRHTSAPSVLLEVCFVSDPDDAKVYLANRKAIAESLALAIEDLL